MPENNSIASKYGAFYRALKAEGFRQEDALKFVHTAFSAEAAGNPTFGPPRWSHDELVGSDESRKRQELFDEFVGKLTAIGGNDE